MFSTVIKHKIEQRYKQEVKYAKQCDALAAHINEVCKCKISGSTIKRLWGFIKKENETRPREWTLDLIAQYIGYTNWSELQNELAGNGNKKKARIESVDTALLKPGTSLIIRFGKLTFIQIRYKGKGYFIVTGENKSEVRLNDEVEIEKINLNLPMLIKKLKRSGTTIHDIILGDITGVTEIMSDDSPTTKSRKPTNGILTSNK